MKETFNDYQLRISNKYGRDSEQIACHHFEITWRIFRIRIASGFKLTFADWLKFSLIEELPYEIDV
jgi:hypothetical protein